MTSKHYVRATETGIRISSTISKEGLEFIKNADPELFVKIKKHNRVNRKQERF